MWLTKVTKNIHNTVQTSNFKSILNNLRLLFVMDVQQNNTTDFIISDTEAATAAMV